MKEGKCKFAFYTNNNFEGFDNSVMLLSQYVFKKYFVYIFTLRKKIPKISIKMFLNASKGDIFEDGRKIEEIVVIF